MPFNCYLTFPEIQEITQAAIDSGLITEPRVLLFQDIRKSFVARLKTNPAPLTQFSLDLARLNCVERLEDNTVPLAIYLRNAAEQIKDLTEAKIFLTYYNLVQNRAAGIVQLGPLATLPAAVITKEAIIHQDDTVDKLFLDGCLKAAQSVAKLVVPRYDGGQQKFVNNAPWLFNGTGWLLTPNLVITNHHVINARRDDEGIAPAVDFDRQARETSVLFDYNDEASNPITWAIKSLEASDPGLDYCILRLTAPVSRDPLILCRQLTQITASTYLPVNIIQHPNGKPKRFALRNNLAVDADNDLLRYYTDTDYGSSGSPVMDDRWRVVALHRGAVFRNAKFQGKDTAFVNVGSQIFRILEDVKLRNPSLYTELSNPSCHLLNP